MGPRDWGRSYRIGRKPSTNKLKMDSKGSAKHGDHHVQFFQKNKRYFHFFSIYFTFGDGSKPYPPVVHIKIAGKWMFIPLKMVCIGIDP
jgi:hypothetical protein